MVDKAIVLRSGREKSVLNRHPWIFLSAIERVEGSPESGETVLVLDAKKQVIAKAAYSPASKIKARVWTTSVDLEINRDYIAKKISESLERRRALLEGQTTTAARLVYGEADGLPGLIVDKYNNTIVLQILSAGAEFWKKEIASILGEMLQPDCIYERSDVEVRTLEGLPERQGLLAGNLKDTSVIMTEHGIKYHVDISEGQKTGFYIDQRDNRQKVFELAKNRDILNCFCYTGGFSLNALAGGAKSVLSVDSSAPALEILNQNIMLNQFEKKEHQVMEGDVFKLLRLFRDQAKSFDMIILDPPKFAPTISQAEKASRAYKDINLLAIKLLRPGGKLVTFSCSGGISRELFQKIIAGAALDAGVEIRIKDYLSQSADHPVLTSFPESFYLKGLVCEK